MTVYWYIPQIQPNILFLPLDFSSRWEMYWTIFFSVSYHTIIIHSVFEFTRYLVHSVPEHSEITFSIFLIPWIDTLWIFLLVVHLSFVQWFTICLTLLFPVVRSVTQHLILYKTTFVKMNINYTYLAMQINWLHLFEYI